MVRLQGRDLPLVRDRRSDREFWDNAQRPPLELNGGQSFVSARLPESGHGPHRRGRALYARSNHAQRSACARLVETTGAIHPIHSAPVVVIGPRASYATSRRPPVACAAFSPCEGDDAQPTVQPCLPRPMPVCAPTHRRATARPAIPRAVRGPERGCPLADLKCAWHPIRWSGRVLDEVVTEK